MNSKLTATLILAAALTCVPRNAPAAQWTHDNIGISTFAPPALATRRIYDHGGAWDIAYVAWQSLSPSAVKVARRSGAAWTTELIESVYSTRDVSVALDSLGRPHLAYIKVDAQGNHTLRYASRDTNGNCGPGLNWKCQTIPVAPGLNASSAKIGIGTDGSKHVMISGRFGATGQPLLLYSHTMPSGEWGALPAFVDIGRLVYRVEVSGPSGVHTLYQDPSFGIRWASNESGTWVTELIAVGGPAGNLRLQPSGKPAVCYSEGGSLKYAHRNGPNSWPKQTMLDTSASQCALQFLPNGEPAIAYQNSTIGVAKRIVVGGLGFNWFHQIVRGSGNYYGLQFGLDGNGKQLMVYTGNPGPESMPNLWVSRE